jgi:uncharacterized protein
LAGVVLAGGIIATGLHTRTTPNGGGELAFVPQSAAQGVAYRSTREAYEQGLGAYRSGFYEIAIPALEHVVGKTDPQFRFFAEFYLGRIFADNSGAHTDHAKAYMLFQRIADEHADIDPDDLKRAPFVAKALTAVAIYVRDGLPEISLKPDEQRAVEYLRHAATFFNEPDAQFELSKLLMQDPVQRPAGLHYLQKLSQEGHAAAQAVLADLLARGKYVSQDHARALGLIKIAVEHASASDRLWIEDIYQNIYCGSNKDVREKSKGLVTTWKKLFAQPRSAVEQPMGLGKRGDTMPTRVCSNGERLDLQPQSTDANRATPPANGTLPASSLMPSSTPAPIR